MAAATSRASTRFSTYSGAPSLHPSLAPTTCSSATSILFPPSRQSSISHSTTLATATSNNNHPYQYQLDEKTMQQQQAPHSSTATIASTASDSGRTQDIKTFAAGFERMQDARLDAQRYVMSGRKGDEISTNALGAKLERALGRRMTGQDATFTRPRVVHRLGGGEKRSLEIKA